MKNSSRSSNKNKKKSNNRKRRKGIKNSNTVRGIKKDVEEIIMENTTGDTKKAFSMVKTFNSFPKKAKTTIIILIIVIVLLIFAFSKNNTVIKDTENVSMESANENITEINGITEEKDNSENNNNYNERPEGLVTNGRVDAHITRVVDGDTFVAEIAGKEYKVRLIGVDTPESVHPKKEKNTEFGKKVSEYSKQNLEGKDVVLEFDVSVYDRYSRLLAYVYVDGVPYNEKLLEEGYAKTMTIQPNVQKADYYNKLQEEAKEQGRGFWSEDFKDSFDK